MSAICAHCGKPPEGCIYGSIQERMSRGRMIKNRQARDRAPMICAMCQKESMFIASHGDKLLCGDCKIEALREEGNTDYHEMCEDEPCAECAFRWRKERNEALDKHADLAVKYTLAVTNANRENEQLTRKLSECIDTLVARDARIRDLEVQAAVDKARSEGRILVVDAALIEPKAQTRAEKVADAEAFLENERKASSPQPPQWFVTLYNNFVEQQEENMTTPDEMSDFNVNAVKEALTGGKQQTIISAPTQEEWQALKKENETLKTERKGLLNQLGDLQAATLVTSSKEAIHLLQIVAQLRADLGEAERQRDQLKWAYEALQADAESVPYLKAEKEKLIAEIHKGNHAYNTETMQLHAANEAAQELIKGYKAKILEQLGVIGRLGEKIKEQDETPEDGSDALLATVTEGVQYLRRIADNLEEANRIRS